MEKILLSALRAPAAVLAGTTAHADGTNTPVLDQRQENQERRIEQGVESGALHHRQDHTSRAIARKKHNSR
ncbi:MAG: hypothetical protein IPK48_15400 [Gammaproteobacteria bacterium]|nr:hypothetical protein [Gammaproteobacteria bacterium]